MKGKIIFKGYLGGVWYDHRAATGFIPRGEAEDNAAGQPSFSDKISRSLGLHHSRLSMLLPHPQTPLGLGLGSCVASSVYVFVSHAFRMGIPINLSFPCHGSCRWLINGSSPR
jgi:hypothetical protein